MTKEEFTSMLNSELESLEKEYQLATQRVGFFRTVNFRDKEFQEAEYQLKMVRQKVEALRSLVTLPAYARIQAMSDAEIEEFKKGKIEELELKIREIQAREEQEKARFSQLKAEREKLIVQFGNLSGNEREMVIYRGRQLIEEISRYDVNNRWGVFAKLKIQIEETRKQQEQIKAMSSQEIKQQLSSEIKESRYLAQKIEMMRDPIAAFTELEASVASDPEKAQQMANLLTAYGRISNEQSQIKCRMYLGYELSIALEKILTKYYDPETKEISNPDKLMEAVQEFEGSFEQAKASFNEQFTPQKLSKLVDKYSMYYSANSSEVDMGFLQQHTDKIGGGELEHLQSLVEQRNKLSKKIFKTRDTKWKIADLNTCIDEKENKIYQEIIGWYESQSENLLGISHSYGVPFYSLEALQAGLKRCKEEIHISEQAIPKLKESIKEAKAEMEREKQIYENKKVEIVQQIRALSGEKHKETDIPNYVMADAEHNLDQIAKAPSYVYQKDIVDRVQQEAQNQADIKEAELRGLTIEQLLQMRKQAKAMDDESIIEANEESVSHSI